MVCHNDPMEASGQRNIGFPGSNCMPSRGKGVIAGAADLTPDYRPAGPRVARDRPASKPISGRQAWQALALRGRSTLIFALDCYVLPRSWRPAVGKESRLEGQIS